jgi:hypothetical protein
MTTHSAKIREMTGPVDRVAARVMQGGIHYERQVHETEKHWKDNPPRCIPFVRQTTNPQSVDLTGTRYGRMTVVGYLGPVGKTLGKSRKRMGLWLVRCACSAFEQRSTRAIKNPENSDDCCGDCRHLKYLQQRALEGHSDEAMQKRMRRAPR